MRGVLTDVHDISPGIKEEKEEEVARRLAEPSRAPIDARARLATILRDRVMTQNYLFRRQPPSALARRSLKPVLLCALICDRPTLSMPRDVFELGQKEDPGSVDPNETETDGNPNRNRGLGIAGDVGNLNTTSQEPQANRGETGIPPR